MEQICCPICNGHYDKPICLDCGHVFCYECIASLLTKECPTCRSVIVNKMYPIVECLNFGIDDSSKIELKINERENELKELKDFFEKQLNTSLNELDKNKLVLNNLQTEIDTLNGIIEKLKVTH